MKCHQNDLSFLLMTRVNDWDRKMLELILIPVFD